MIGTEEGVGQIKTIEGSKEAVKAKGQTKHMMSMTGLFKIKISIKTVYISNTKITLGPKSSLNPVHTTICSHRIAICGA